MTQAENEKAIADILMLYIPMYHNAKLTKEGLALYVKALNGFSPEQIEIAMQRILRKNKFYPMVSEIFEAIEEITDTVKRESGDKDRYLTAAEAWEEVMENARKHGIYKPWVYSSPIVERAVRQFGREELCLLEMDVVGVARAQFTKIYEQCLKQAKSHEAVADIFQKIGTQKANTLIAQTMKQITG